MFLNGIRSFDLSSSRDVPRLPRKDEKRGISTHLVQCNSCHADISNAKLKNSSFQDELSPNIQLSVLHYMRVNLTVSLTIFVDDVRSSIVQIPAEQVRPISHDVSWDVKLSNHTLTVCIQIKRRSDSIRKFRKR
ncbi:hypothetical protein Tcan_00706, partial [Toxocara canis]